MTAIPHAAMALTSALGRFERASKQMLEAATGEGPAAENPVAPIVEVMEAKAQFQAGVGVLKFADAMWGALLDLQTEREPV